MEVAQGKYFESLGLNHAACFICYDQCRTGRASERALKEEAGSGIRGGKVF